MTFDELDNMCGFYIEQAEEYLSMITPINAYKEIFEAYTPDTKMKVEQNAKARTGVAGTLKKALDYIKNMIHHVISTIKNFFNKSKLDEEQRAAYEKFKAACEKNPELKNKKIYVEDFTKMNAEYQAILKEAEAADRALAEGRAMDTDKLLARISSFCKNIGSGAGVAVTADAALKIAGSSREAAAMMYNTMQSNEKVYNTLVNALGAKETERLGKQLESLTKRVSVQRGIMRMKGTYCKSLEGVVKKTYDNIANITSVVSDFKDGKNIRGGVKAAKAAVKNSDLIRKMNGNEDIHNAARYAAKSTIAAKLDSASAVRHQKNTETKHKIVGNLSKIKNKLGIREPAHNQSLKSSILGLNDPNSRYSKKLKEEQEAEKRAKKEEK